MSWLSSLKSGYNQFKSLGSKIWNGAGALGQKITNGLHDKRLKSVIDAADMLTGKKYNLGGYLNDAQNFAKDGMRKYKGISNVMNGKSDGKSNKNRDMMAPHTQPQADISRGQTSQNRYNNENKPSKNSLERQKRPDKNEDYLGSLFE